jgi:protein ImuB
MGLTEARMLCPDLACVEADPKEDRRALAALGRWLTRFTPAVSLGWDDDDDGNEDGDHDDNDRDGPIPALFLDLTGCERLFGGLDRLVGLVTRSLAGFGIPARLAVAPTPGAAWALAFAGEQPAAVVVDDATSLHAALAPLPVEVLRLDGEPLGDLHHLGLHRVGDVLALPRAQLPARFGPSLLRRLDQLTGALPEPLTNLVDRPPITAKLEFEAPIEEPQTVGLVFEKLLDRVLADLARLNHGIRQLRLVFTPDRGWGRPATVTRTIALGRPHRDRATLLELVRREIERVDCEHGFVRFRLDVPLHEAITDAQGDLFEPRLIEEQLDLDRLFLRLRARLGDPAVIRPACVESYLPERAWRPAPVDAPMAAPQTSRSLRAPRSSDVPNQPPPPPAPPRPLTLFATPLEIGVVCEPSDDRTGRPRQFTWRGAVYRLAHAVGPERIAGEWWRGHHRTRDYYDVEDDAGQRFWLFRVPQQDPEGATVGARWFLHGRFD